ncbi:PGF-pre-PGF domain-containing protein [Methanofollis formosanus]|uniref:PGF-pre-PGF domain-containing protein n=1 Tax=Methanofollis formosanus TaxID=299308 RepID=A0A8G1EGG2_9EURY|nr:right-handed parallel beta-helix repeat-containing protein [Methanofollis formosanus]QYZ79770.1 PGF-pre-PGF domain-containing protein [Methanofollis formosanus]
MEKEVPEIIINPSNIFRILICVSILGYLVSGVAASPPPAYSVNATGWWDETGAFNPAPANPIQAALTNASAGSVVTVVEQTSYPSSLVFDAKSITLDLNGSILDGSAITDRPGITLAGANDVTIKNGQIAHYQDSIQFTGNSDGVSISDVAIVSSGRHGIYFYRDCANTVFSNITITDPKKTGITKYDYSKLANITVRDSTVTNAGNNGIVLNDYSSYHVRDIVLSNVTVTNVTETGISVGQDRISQSRNVTVRDCTVKGAGENGVRVLGRGTVVIDGVETGENGNNAGDGSYYGLYLKGFDAPTVTLTNTTVENNRNGLYLDGVSDLLLDGDVIVRDNGGYPYYLRSCDNITVRDNTLGPKKPYTHGLYLAAVTNSTFQNITVASPDQHGIYFREDCANTLFSNITITDPKKTGITKYDSSKLANITVRDSTVTNAGNNGIVLNDYSSYHVRDIVLSNVTVTNVTETGISVGQDRISQSRNVTVRDCTVKGAGENGVRVLGRGTVVIDGVETGENGNNAGDGSYYGLYLKGFDAPTVTLTNTTIENNTNGLYLNGVSDILLDGGVIVRDNGGYPYYLQNCDNITVRDNTLGPKKPYTHGLYLAAVTNSTFRNITVASPDQHGIYFREDCANMVFSNVTITDPKKTGITKYDSSKLANITVRDSTVTNAGNNGIVLNDYSSYYVRDIVLSNVTVTNVTETGISVGQDRTSQSGNVTVRDCTVKGAGENGVRVLGRGKVVIDGVETRENGGKAGDGSYYGLYLRGYDDPTVTLTNTTIENNTNGLYLNGVSDILLDGGVIVRDNGGYPYYLQSCDNITVRDNTLGPKPYTRGLYLAAVTNSTFRNITIDRANGDALWFEGTSTGLVFDAITITKPGKSGIYFYRDCANTVFSNVTITDPAAGITKYYSSNLANITVRDSTVTNARGDGIALDDDSSHAVRDIALTNVTVRNATGNGIIIRQDSREESRNITLRDCTVEGAEKYGVELRARGTAVIDGVETRENGDNAGDGTYYGLYLKGYDAPTVTLINTTVEKNRNGLYLEQVSDLLLDNGVTVLDNGGYPYNLQNCDNITVRDHALGPKSYTHGLYLASVTNSTFKNITVASPDQHGIYFRGDCANTIFSNITITDPAAGITKYYSSNLANITIRDSTVTNASENGIVLDDDSSHAVRDIVLTNVTVRNTTGNGIIVGQESRAESKNITLQDCTVEGSGNHGIELKARGGVRVLDCEASGNARTGMVLTGIERPLLVFENATITGNNQAMQITGINATITDSALAGTTGDLDLRGNAHITLSNTTHDRTKVTLDGTSRLAVLWPLIVTTTDLTGNVVAGADVTAADVNGTVALTAQTGADGRTGPHLLTEYTRNGTAPAVLSTPYTLTASAPIGSASDTTDLSSPTTVTLRLFKDTEPPAITYVAPTPEDGARSPANVTVKVLVTDDVGVAGALLEVNGVNATMNLDGAGTTVYASAKITGDGVHRYRVYANDSAGNMNVTGMRSVGISTTPPPGVTDLAATTISETAITWTWTDPADPTFDRVMLFLNGTFLTNVSVGVGTYTTTDLAPDTAYLLSTRSVDFCGQANATWVSTTARTAPDRTPPASVTDLTAATVSETAITWTWTDPADADFDRVMLALDGTFLTNVSAGVGTYTTTDLAPDTAYLLSTRTVDIAGNLNQTWVNATARTTPDQTPPAGVTDLTAATISETAITWTWTDPADADFAAVRVYWDGALVEVPAGEEHFNATGLAPDTGYQIGTRTVDTAGNLNQTWVNATARTAPDRTPPAGVTDLTAATVSETAITWTWTDPADADFAAVRVYWNGTDVEVPAGEEHFNATGLAPDTGYQIGTRTVDTAGNLNQTWVNATARTAPDRIPPASVTDLTAATISETAITWTWTDPADADFDRVMLSLNGTFLTNVSAGVGTYTTTDLAPDTGYQIGTRTVDTAGNINQTRVNATARTAPDQTPPAGVTDLTAATISETAITWTWTDPADADFAAVRVYWNGTDVEVPAGDEHFNATGLAPDTGYQIGTRTVDTAGNINQTWVNATARTASVQPSPTPTSSSSGSGGGNSRTSAASAKPLLPDQQSSLSFKGTAIYVIDVIAADATRDLLFTVEDAGSLPAGIPCPDDETYCIEHVEQYRTNDSDIATATIRFSVSKAWLDERGYHFSDIVLLRFHNGVWTEIPTTFEGEKDGYYYYSAETPGFSYFAIVYRENGTIVPEVTAPAREAAANTSVTSEPTPPPEATRTTPTQSPSVIFGILGTSIAIIVASGAARIRKR